MRTGPEGEGRARDLEESVHALWPGYATSRDRAARGERDAEEYLVLPRASRPTLMAPRRPRAATAAALRGYKVSATRRTQLVLRLISRAARLGLLDIGPLRRTLTPPVDPAGTGTGTGTGQRSIRDYLRAALEDDTLVVALHTSGPKANRKPVLQVLTGGRTTAFAKVGTTELAQALVDREAEALRRLATVELRRVAAPALLHHGTWREHRVLVQSPFLVPSDGSLTPQALAEAMAEIALLTPATAYPGRTAPYVCCLRDRVSRLPVTPAAGVLAECLAALDDSGSLDGPVRLGHWHGDWTPWNMTAHEGRALVWDWERFDDGVPVGFDALHYDVQGAMVRFGRPPREAVRDLVDRSPSLLRPFGVEPEQATVYAVLYLVEIGTRYLHDRQEEAGSARGRLETWLLPELEDRVRRLVAGAH